MPTYTEWNNANTNGNWTNDVSAYASVLKLHDAGWLMSSNGMLFYRGTNGAYWQSTQSSTDWAWEMIFSSSGSGIANSGDDYGMTLRCLNP
jgi:hypothetical protein